MRQLECKCTGPRGLNAAETRSDFDVRPLTARKNECKERRHNPHLPHVLSQLRLVVDFVFQHVPQPRAKGPLWYAPHTASIHGELAPGSQWRDGAILWDAYLLYGPDAKWADAPTTGLVHWG